MIGESIAVDAYHESGHCIIGKIIGVPVKRATITQPAHVTLSMAGVLKMALSDGHRAVFFLAGMTVQRYYFPSVPITSTKDQAVLMGLPEHRRIAYTDFINHQLEDPAVRKKIEDLADLLITVLSIDL